MLNRNLSRVLITGASGYIGGQVAQSLVERGWDVHALVRTKTFSQQKLPFITNHAIDGSYDSIADAVNRIQANITLHIASSVIVHHDAQQLNDLIISNILFPIYVVQAITEAGLGRLINTGTSWEHFDTTDRYEPANLYAATKRAFEDLCNYFVSSGSLSMITLKLFDVYGPNDTRGKIIPLLLRLSESESPLAMSPGGQLLDMVFISDVVDSYLAASKMMLDSYSGMGSYVVRSGRVLPLQGIVSIFETCLGRKLNIVWSGRPYRKREVMAPWTSLHTLPNWRARVSLESGLQKVISEYSSRNQGL